MAVRANSDPVAPAEPAVREIRPGFVYPVYQGASPLPHEPEWSLSLQWGVYGPPIIVSFVLYAFLFQWKAYELAQQIAPQEDGSGPSAFALAGIVLAQYGIWFGISGWITERWICFLRKRDAGNECLQRAKNLTAFQWLWVPVPYSIGKLLIRLLCLSFCPEMVLPNAPPLPQPLPQAANLRPWEEANTDHDNLKPRTTQP